MNKEYLLKLLNFFPPGLAYLPFKHIMLGKKFFQWTELLQRNEGKDVSWMQEYQLTEMKKLLQNAYNGSSFYRKKYDAAGFHPDSIRELSDIKQIPILTRKEVKENARDMILKGVNRNGLYRVYTSGTTGSPIICYGDISSRIREWASLCYIWGYAGYAPSDRRVEFRGTVPDNKIFENRPEVGLMRVNVNNIGPNTVHKLTDEIIAGGFKFISGYPGAISNYAMEIKKQKLKDIPNIQGIFLSSEMVYQWQVDVIQGIFKKAKIISFYGMAEKVALAYRDNTDSKYKFIPTYALVEKDEDTGVLVGTSFVNTVMPLIRYRTNDVLLGEECFYSGSEEGTLFPVFDDIAGREGDMLRTATGDKVSPAALTFIFKGIKHLDATKIIQHNSEKLVLKFESKSKMNEIEPELQDVKQKLQGVLGEKMDVAFEHVDRIEREPSGKFKWIESDLTSVNDERDKKGINIILSLDYEIYGEGSGDIRKDMVVRTEKILSTCDKYGVPITIMFEINEYLKFEEFNDALVNDLGYSPASLVKEQIIDAFSRGHDVQLHFHPQWLNAGYEQGKWKLLEKTDSVEDLDPEEFEEMLTKGKEKILSMLDGIRDDFSLNTVRFTGYNWREAPEKVFGALERAGIKAHSLAYTSSEEKDTLQGYWSLTRDGSLYEVPIFALKASRANIFSPIKLLSALHSHSITGSGEMMNRVKDQVLSPKEKKPYYKKWDMCKLFPKEMLSMLKKGLQLYSGTKKEVPLVMIGHSKDLFAGIFMDKFLKKAIRLVEKHGGRFTTFHDFVERNL